MITTEQIQKRIIETIKQSGMTQVELAKKLQLTQSSIAHYIKGDIMPSPVVIANLCQILDVSPEYIMCFRNQY